MKTFLAVVLLAYLVGYSEAQCPDKMTFGTCSAQSCSDVDLCVWCTDPSGNSTSSFCTDWEFHDNNLICPEWEFECNGGDETCDYCTGTLCTDSAGYTCTNSGELHCTCGDPYTCFPGDATVETIEGTKQMREVRIGDMLKTLDSSMTPYYSRVYHIANQEETTARNFVHLHHEKGVFRTTFQHLLFVKVPGEQSWNPKMASEVQEGWRVRGEAEEWEVTSVDQGVLDVGHYSPMTESGTMLVDGVLSSCHARYHSLGRIIFLPHLIVSRMVSLLGLHDSMTSLSWKLWLPSIFTVESYVPNKVLSLFESSASLIF